MKEIILTRIAKHTVDSDIVFSRRCPRVFIHPGLKFTYDREYFLVEVYILLILVLFRPCGRGEKVENR